MDANFGFVSKKMGGKSYDVLARREEGVHASIWILQFASQSIKNT